MERAYIFLACKKNIGSLHKKITMHAFPKGKTVCACLKMFLVMPTPYLIIKRLTNRRLMTLND